LEPLIPGEILMSLQPQVLPWVATRKKTSHVKKPDFFIVGAPKCGTTAMTRYLAAHPDIFMAKKEMHFFGADLRFGRSFYRRGLRAYLEEYATRNGELRAGEASVWYLFSKAAAAEIRTFNPDSHIIIMLRQPADMLYSLYHEFRFDANEHLTSFETALNAEGDRRAGRRTSRATYFPQGLVYRETARYTEQVERYFEFFGRHRVHVTLYDDFAANPAAACHEILQFLGLDPSRLQTEFSVINGGDRTVKSAALRVVLTDPLVRSTVVASRPWLPRPVFAALQNAETWLWRSNTRFEKRPPLAADLRNQLRREFAPEVERLSKLLGRDLSHWTK
jgi:hypothetical protein